MYRRLLIFVVLSVYILFNTIQIGIDNNKQQFINVDIDGEVLNPGTYRLPLGSTLDDLFELSDLKENAQKDVFNPNKHLSDKENIYVSDNSKSLISINHASYEELITLPGIGETIANRIIDYRNTYGSFLYLEELLYINGIGDKKYDKLKEYICL